MASTGSFDVTRNRTYLLCCFCKTVQASLPVHLRMKCMKDSPPSERLRVLEVAKKEAHELLRRGRVMEYSLLRRIMDSPTPVESMMQELEKRGIVVVNVPPPLPVPPRSEAAASEPAASTSEPAASPPPSSESSGNSEEYYQQPNPAHQKTSLREKMSKAGLYNKHSTDHPLLKGFSHYLEVDLANENFSQEVDNVARFMYFMDPQRPSIQFVRQLERSREYFNTLSDIGLSKQTVHNYIKSIKRFLRFQTGSTNLGFSDEQLYNDCKKFIDFLSNLQAVTSKQVSKEVTRKRLSMLTEGVMSPNECQAVLRAARMDFLVVMGKLTDPGGIAGHQLSQPESQLVLYYLEAILILKHYQRPGVVEHLTVKEWLLRQRDDSERGHVVVGVHETFALCQEEEMWFETYYTEVRPTMMAKKRKVEEAEGGEPDERFFISSTGNPIYNASNDLERLHKKYNLPRVTSQMARRALETAAKHLTDAEKSLVADYLSHSSATAERHDRTRDKRNVVKTNLLMEKLGAHSDEKSEPSNRCTKISEMVAFDLLIKTFPVTIDGLPPKRPVRVWLTGVEHQRHCYDRWREVQKNLRVQHILDHFGRRLPREDRVRIWIQRQGWSANLPDAALLVKQWKPSGSVQTALDSTVIQKMVRRQRWKGLVAVPMEGKGRGVIATRPFQIGEAVCDYHGKVVSSQEGIETHKSTIGTESGYMFLFKTANGQSKCIDAHLEECECHPGKETIGRLINHSSKRANVRPRHYSLDGRDVVLFIATHKIEVNTEILFDYGVNKKSFAGEGLDLDWL